VGKFFEARGDDAILALLERRRVHHALTLAAS
jgi:hypothetical protein